MRCQPRSRRCNHARVLPRGQPKGLGTICAYPKFTPVPFREEDLWNGYECRRGGCLWAGFEEGSFGRAPETSERAIYVLKTALLCTDSDLWGLWGFGIRMISAVLRRAGHSTRLIFLPPESQGYPPDVLEETKELVKSADVIGLSCYSQGSRNARQLTTCLRELRKPIVWGGLHATLNPGECAETADIVCRGEGESTILELAEILEAGRDWGHVRNLAYIRRSQLVINPVRPPIRDLDELPLFDFERQDEFHLTKGQIIQASWRAEDSPKGQAYFIGSRGCGFHCTYCCNRRLKELYAGNGNYVRRMSVSKYVEQLDTLHKRHFPRATGFFLFDEDFFMRSVEELREFSELYRKRIGIPFSCLASPPRITGEKLEHLVKAGLWKIGVGVESGSERTKQEVYQRKISNDLVLKAAKSISDFPTVVPCYFFIIGNPYEEESDLLDTLRFMARLTYPYYANIYNLVFFPGSALYARALKDGIISGAQDSGYELDTRAGFKYQAQTWKRKNLYLNSLLFLTEGKVTRHRLGLLPRFLIPFLTHGVVIRFLEPRASVSQALIAGKSSALYLRMKVGLLLRKVIADPRGVYDLKLYFRNAGKKALATLLRRP